MTRYRINRAFTGPRLICLFAAFGIVSCLSASDQDYSGGLSPGGFSLRHFPVYSEGVNPTDGDDDTEWEDWITAAVESFAGQHQMLNHVFPLLSTEVAV